MATIHFKTIAGETLSVNAKPGETLMQAAMENSVPGVEAMCGGFCSCATCHVYIGEDWLARMPAMTEDEDAMIDGAMADRLPTSRLSCQIPITDELDGLEVTVPPIQS